MTTAGQYQAMARYRIASYEPDGGEWGDWMHYGYFSSARSARHALSRAKGQGAQVRIRRVKAEEVRS